ncbi:large conductance mechanosensitive channel protein MscL [Streptomyces althioticus]|uniref:Large-conductance mechanosensitive channel n=2 Tax=Actinomycetota TaxID=201174 RepID=A0ABR4T2G9_9ACTN|nr:MULTISPECIES: large conductance mechanosensitive channel protein MscL [Actinomycetes]ALV51344.1 mechanosensitive ion channel protein [Streptomyces sp. 4F]KEG41643.1 mechanosensitive ion channel protein [Streptomyces griseorubens]MBM4830280.1 large conductance mechanosensitive channel protein MscL [Actinospica acidiphila]WTC24698.1 large conductance mechanosensitive channel protein MscL [Streptomyces althioticus]
MSDQEKTSLWQGFKAFLMRGNVVDLAVAVVIGAAFTNIVNSVVEGVINPLVGAFGTQNLDSYTSCLKGPCEGTGDAATGVRILWGSVLGATLQFVLTAAVVYFLMVLPMAKYLARVEARRKAKEGAHEVVEVTELEVLKEIRDALLAERAQGGGRNLRADDGGRTGEGRTGDGR